MGINFFAKSKNIATARIQYVQESKYDDVRIEPCDKFVACIQKLSKNYVLALREADVNIEQVANQSDIEFYEGYDLAEKYTDSVRRNICIKLIKVYDKISRIVDIINRITNFTNNNREILHEIKMESKVANNIISNIYQHVSMNMNIPHSIFVEEKNDYRELVEKLRTYALETVWDLSDLEAMMIIEYIKCELQYLINKFNNYNDYFEKFFN